jgi:hypothetical protein
MAAGSRNTAFAFDHVHCRAICDEIGERLRYALEQGASDVPPRLVALIDKLAEMDPMPSIVPSIEEMSSLGCLGPPTSSAGSEPDSLLLELVYELDQQVGPHVARGPTSVLIHTLRSNLGLPSIQVAGLTISRRRGRRPLSGSLPGSA